MESYKFEKKTTERYDIRVDYEWAIIMISEDGGVFSAHSSYGDYTYAWPHHGRESFKHFIMNELTRDTSYFLGKVSSETEFDEETSLKEWKETIIRDRRNQEISEEEARSVWDALIEITEECSSIDSVYNALYSNSDISEMGYASYEDFPIYTDFPAGAKIFASRFMPILGDILKKEIEEKEKTL